MELIEDVAQLQQGVGATAEARLGNLFRDVVQRKQFPRVEIGRHGQQLLYQCFLPGAREST